jgi:CubicO group peptidase (beta-lactamase class C family)
MLSKKRKTNKRVTSITSRTSWLFIFLVLVILVVNFYPTKSFRQTASVEEFTAHLNEQIPDLMENYAIPGVTIALIKRGELVWSEAYGYADLEKGQKMTIDTYCRVESISKSVTAWGVMKLVEEGKVELDHPVTHYLKNWEFPASEFSTEKITIRQLLSHQAGMPLGNIEACYSPQESIPSLRESLSKEAILQQSPGLSFSYSNTGFDLLELVIEEVTGRDFAQYMEEEVLVPLGMNQASFNWSEAFEPPVPMGYGLQGNSILVYVYPEKASGGLFASVEDIATFVVAGMPAFSRSGRQVIDARNIKRLYQPTARIPGLYGLVFDSYGLGYFIEQLPSGHSAVSHGGQGAGWMTHFHSVPETGDGIVILTNSQRSWPLIAYILQDWAKWGGFSSVGMANIILGIKVLRVVISLLLISVILQLGLLGQGVLTGKRHFAPLSKEAYVLRLAQISLFAVLVVGLGWSINQEYLFLTSVFPITTGWLGISIFLVALVLLLSDLFPQKKQQ